MGVFALTFRASLFIGMLIQVPGKNYYIDQDSLEPYSQAVTKCNEGELARISNKQDQNKVETYMTDNGINDRVWFALSFVNDEYQWSHDNRLQWAGNWKAGHPPSNPVTDGKECVQIVDDTFEWEAVGCNNSNLFLCQKNAGTNTVDTVTPLTTTGMTTQSLTTTEFSTAPGITESTHPWDICFVCSNGFIRTHKNAEVGIRSDVIYFFKSKLECAATCARNSKCKVFSFGLDGKCQVFIQVNTASMLTFPTPGTSIWERQ